MQCGAVGTVAFDWCCLRNQHQATERASCELTAATWCHVAAPAHRGCRSARPLSQLHFAPACLQDAVAVAQAQPHMMVGTPAYVAPEVLARTEVRPLLEACLAGNGGLPGINHGQRA